jgi:hypothetical protein
MSFVVDRKARRTYDPKRGYELFPEGGGSDGRLRFRLVGPVGETKFTAEFGNDPLTEHELERLGPNFDKTPIVWTVSLSDQKWDQIIREAMEAFMFSHGTPFPNRQSFVRFGSKGSVFNT